jgi:hypothetical protein
MHRGADGKQRALLPAPWNARTRVHEYGGLSYLPVPPAGPGGAPGIVFANFADQRLYLAAGQDAPRPITPDPAAAGAASGEPCGLRFADFTLSPDGTEVWCVQELHNDGKVTRSIVAVPLDGSAAGGHVEIRQLASGSDFFAFPTPSPDGSRLAWISWNHPHMPWDGTELRVAAVKSGVAGPGRVVKGGLRESVMAPVWRDSTSLYVATDWTGWWNIYQVGLTGEPPLALFPAEEEFAGPLWQLGARRSPCSATAGWPCCTAAAAPGSASWTRRPTSSWTRTSRSASSCPACPRTARSSRRWPAARGWPCR